MRILHLIPAIILGLTSLSIAHGEDVQSLYDAAKKLLSAGKIDEAAHQFEACAKLLEKEGRSDNAWKMYQTAGGLFFNTGDAERAIDNFSAALSLLPITSDADLRAVRRNLATCYSAASLHLLALAEYKRLLEEKDAWDKETLANLNLLTADSCMELELYRDAVRYYQEGLQHFEKTGEHERVAVILTNKGRAYSRLGDFEQAELTFKAAWSLKNKHTNAQNYAEIASNQGILLWDQGRYREALDLILQALEIEEMNDLEQNMAADYNNLGLIYKSIGRYAQATSRFNESIRLARKLQDPRSEAIALSNRALTARIQTNYSVARSDYLSALALYEVDDFQEGRASAYLGLARLQEEEHQDYVEALELAQDALDLYVTLENAPYEAEARVLIAFLIKRGNTPTSTTRDLLPPGEQPTYLRYEEEEAWRRMTEHLQRVLLIADESHLPEHEWSARQGLGYIAWRNSRLEEAAEHYDAAIRTVMQLRGASNETIMGTYMQDKEELFNEAITVLSALYTGTQEESHLERMFEYQTILENEVMKTLMDGTRVAYADESKEELKLSLRRLDQRRTQLGRQLGNYNRNAGRAVPENDTLGARAAAEQAKASAEEASLDLKKRLQTIENTYEEQLKQWKETYPNDADLFDSAARIDLKTIQKILNANEAILQYFPLREQCLVLIVLPNRMLYRALPISYEEVASYIRDRFHRTEIERFRNERSLKNVVEINNLLHDLYKNLFAPVEQELQGVQKLLIIANKDLAYLPFASLNRSSRAEEPDFLLNHYSISVYRLSFAREAAPLSGVDADTRILAIGNPHHPFLSRNYDSNIRDGFSSLDGARIEIENLERLAVESLKSCRSFFNEEATETQWRNELSSGIFEVLYFATHGMTYAEHHDIYIKAVEKNSWPRFVEFTDQQMSHGTPLSGYLLMSAGPDAAEAPTDANGLLSIKEILELPEISLSKVRLAVLSACNTAVNYAPKVSLELRQELEANELTQAQMTSLGMSPGIDQVCLLDAFKRRGIDAVVATLWFVDDESTQFIVERFFKNILTMQGPEAMRNAQQAWLKAAGNDAIKKHVFYWAPYIYCGR